MSSDPSAPRSRRALLAAAAGTAAALAATAAMPLTVAAHDPDDVAMGVDNATTATTSITSSTGSTAFAGNAAGAGTGYGVLGTAAGAGGVVGWSVAPPSSYWATFDPTLTQYTGVFGTSPAGDHVNFWGSGVWGDSPDTGVYGTGGFGVEGVGGVGVAGYAFKTPGTEGVRAVSPSNSSIALRVIGKARFSRSGRVSMSSGSKTKSVTLSGTTTTSKVFAVLATSESGRWVRAAVPASGKFTIYLNTTLTSSAVVSCFVLD